MSESEIINVGIGFVTGRKNFRNVLKTYLFRWKQASAEIRKKIKLRLFVAYDLDYNNTQVSDYVNIRPDVLDVLDSVLFISNSMIQKEIITLENQRVTSKQAAVSLFDKGYAGKRNSILYYALKSKMDVLIFLDDDEYPLAVTKTREIPLWSGQDVFEQHLEALENADITNGYHCGYISPIPHIRFNDILTEDDFRIFIEAISNDILEWDKMKGIIDNGGVTYASPQVFIDNAITEVEEVNRTKFISGSNLGIKLTKPERVKPFFNPPKARGEDTFLSACLSERKVLRIPCYTFHDGFSTYHNLLDGVLPIRMKQINSDDKKNVMRFYRACVGWIRYKPLYLHIVRPEDFNSEIKTVREKLVVTIPKLSAYFNAPQFDTVITEFDKYCRSVAKHYKLFLDNQNIWELIKDYAVQQAY